MSYRIAFLTCNDLKRFFPSQREPLLTSDDALAAEWLRERGWVVEPVVWNDAAARFSDYDLLVVRSTWDYARPIENRIKYQTWLDEIAKQNIAIANPVATLQWNLNKRYLLELAEAGAPIVPTKFFPRGSCRDLTEESVEWGALVIKPAISAGAFETHRLLDAAEVEIFTREKLGALSAEHDILVQPYIADITTRGEWSCTYIDGECTQTVRKLPATNSWFVQDELGGSVGFADPCPPSVMQVAARTYAALCKRVDALSETERYSDKILYARLDIIETLPTPLVGEVELLEPELFFREPSEQAGIFRARTTMMEQFEGGMKKLIQHHQEKKT